MRRVARGATPAGKFLFRFSAAAARRAPEPRSGLLQLLVLRLRIREAGARIADRRVGLFLPAQNFRACSVYFPAVLQIIVKSRKGS